MTLWIKAFIILLIIAGGCSRYWQRAKESDTGILVLAHGADEKWNRHIQDAVAGVRGNFKKEIAFGMGDAKTIQRSIDKLESAGVKNIVVVPLFLSSHSEMYRQVEYVLGLREEPDILFWILMNSSGRHGSNGNHDAGSDMLEKVKFKIPYRVANPVNYNPLIAGILEERLQKYQFTPQISIFILAHGPVSEEDNKAWLLDLKKYSRWLSPKFKDANLYEMTFRDDAPQFIKGVAIKKIREAVMLEIAKGKKVIVLPFLLAPSGREMEIKKILEGYDCEIISGALLPHLNISVWIESQSKSR